MSVTIKAKYIRIAPRKVRLVVDMIRGEKAERAKSLLRFTVNKSAGPVLKLLNSGLTSAKNEFNWNESNLYIKKITVDEGPKLKRWMPRARGSASPIQKKTSHITMIIDEIEKTEEVIKKKKKSKVDTKTISSLDEVKSVSLDDNNKKPERPEKKEKMKSVSEKGAKSKVFRRKSI